MEITFQPCDNSDNVCKCKSASECGYTEKPPMETVKPLTWEEAKDQVAKAHESDMILMPTETYYKEAAELYASSRVRALEEELNRVKAEANNQFNHLAKKHDELQAAKLEIDNLRSYNSSLQERLEAAENDSVEFTKWVRDVGHMHPYASRSTKQLREMWNEKKHRNPKGEMKPLNKLEKEMFEAMVGRPYDDCKKEWFGSKDDFNIAVQNARDAARVAVGLAKRALYKGESIGNNSEAFNWTERDCEIERKAFWKKEGIETQN